MLGRLQFVSTGFAEEISKGAGGRYYYLPNVRAPAVRCLIAHGIADLADGADDMSWSWDAFRAAIKTLPTAMLQASDQAIAMAASSAMAEAKAA